MVVYVATDTLLIILEASYWYEFLSYRAELAGGTPVEDIGIELRWLSSLRHGSIALSGNKSPLSFVPRALSTPVSHGVLHWARLRGDPDTRKVLWITDDQHKIDACASGVFHLLSAARATLSVDDIFGLVNQLKKMNEKYLKKKSYGDSESQSLKKLPNVTVVIHGIHGSNQATEMYAIIRSLRDQRPLDIVAITIPELLHQVSRDHRSIMEHIYTLAVSATGMVSYSADPSALRWFNQNLFLLVLDANLRFPRLFDERRAFNGLWADLCDRAARVYERRDDVTRSTHEIVALLSDAAEDRNKILQFLSDVPAITEDEIHIHIDKDNAEIAPLLQQLLKSRWFNQNLFLLVLDANLRFPRLFDERRAFFQWVPDNPANIAFRLWADLCDREARVCERRDDVTRSTHEIVALLSDAAEDRNKILQVF
ncbi:hypothetical protein GGX14DRAFT_398133 [Mycena pura]|uniref:Uncharacterized protein n=1 Tax=Mycena pura TaxID=153505 RepID=A0AAD6V821_9AGAR|nr:hypothetical protein GGX14DRAFT_398133 [Mycena pura]